MNRSLVALLLLPAVAVAAPVPKAKVGKLLVVTADGKVTLLNADGSDPQAVVECGAGDELLHARLSPDGKRLAYAVKLKGADADTVVRVRPVAGGELTDLTTIRGEGKGQLLPRRQVRSLFWSPDGKAVAGTFHDRVDARKKPGLSDGWTNFRLDAATGERTDLHTVTEYRAFAFTPDGAALICTRGFEKPPVNNRQVIAIETARVPTDKTAPTVVIADQLDLHPTAAFPDGKRWVVWGVEDNTRKFGVYTAGEKRPGWWPTEPTDIPVPAAVSPDGSRVAYGLNPVGKMPSGVWVADADGTNAKKVWEPNAGVGGIDWR